MVIATDAVMKFWFVLPRLIRVMTLVALKLSKLSMSSSALGTGGRVLNWQLPEVGYILVEIQYIFINQVCTYQKIIAGRHSIPPCKIYSLWGAITCSCSARIKLLLHDIINISEVEKTHNISVRALWLAT